MRRHIRVVAILCRAVRGTGKPYTKRILPEHLIARSPFWSGKLVKLLEGELAARCTEAACAALGCVDPRTARKHMQALHAAVDARLPILAELIATAPIQAESPVFSPGTNPFVILKLLWKSFIGSKRELLGSGIAAAIRPLLWIRPGVDEFQLFNRSCIPIPFSP